MNTSQLSKYAPEARKAFIAAVSAQAARLGITVGGIEPATVQGDFLLVGGQAYPKSFAEPRRRLVERIEAHGFDQTMEAVAYTWFNRFAAIRYMELHGYLDHGYRVLSHPEGLGRPELLDHAADLELPGLDREKAVELKLDGTKDEALYRLLLLAQCNALHQAMPFLFEKIGDETELLLPANLLHTDSLIRQLVEQVDEELWQEIEIIGWLYQFYISEKKDQVIGKVVKSEDIPAATQLFTPNWIVKYMVQNSLGALWLATYPQSPLKGQMEYYIEPAEQTDEVKAQLAAITPSQLNPEELTLIDPASGSGHILVEAYELFKAIYLERGYQQRDVPQLILEKNLFGLDIDERAAQLTGFALMMKGRADDRQLFEREAKLNVMALVDSAGFDEEGLAQGVKLADYGLKPRDLTELKRLFEHATTFGSLIQVPEEAAATLPALKQLSEASSQDLFVSEALKRMGPLVRQAEMLAAQYDAVVANPPYMGSNSFTAEFKQYAKENYYDSKSDLFSLFIDRAIALTNENRQTALVTMQAWMFLTAFEALREKILKSVTIDSLLHIGYNSFPALNSKIAQACSFATRKSYVKGFQGVFVDLNSAPQSADKHQAFLQRELEYPKSALDFSKLPGSPIVYWLSDRAIGVFESSPAIGSKPTIAAAVGLQTSDNDRFLRRWYEVDFGRIGLGVSRVEESLEYKWFPYNKGGDYRKWYGNQDYILNWENDGKSIRNLAPKSVVRNSHLYFCESVGWSDITTANNSFRYYQTGFIFDSVGLSSFYDRESEKLILLSFLNNKYANQVTKALNPTIHFPVSYFRKLPYPERMENHLDALAVIVRRLVDISRYDWDASELSFKCSGSRLLSTKAILIESSLLQSLDECEALVSEARALEEENNRLFIDAYGLGEELTPDVPVEQITLTVNPTYRYGGKLTEEEQWTRFRQDTLEELVSYAIGCMMGRYSLDAPGLIYAHSRNDGFDGSRYTTFPADDDGIVPLTDTEWFDDDAAHRLIEFISVAWEKSHLEDNLTFLADNLRPKKNESSRETIRRYLCDKFFKDHLKTYKKRPIYWLFSSGKQKAFQCLVYLHRYNEGTLARMRSEYVIPLQGKMAARIEQLSADVQAATSTAHRKRLEKEQQKLTKQQVELLALDEKLRHYADKRIALDLDDGVKVNYGKFGDLLAEVKAVHGKKVAG